MSSQGMPSTWFSTSGKRSAWASCRCGKIRNLSVPAWVAEETVEMYVRVMGKTSCRRCELEYFKEADHCPETIVTPTAVVTTCGLRWGHTGRCQPWKP